MFWLLLVADDDGDLVLLLCSDILLSNGHSILLRATNAWLKLRNATIFISQWHQYSIFWPLDYQHWKTACWTSPQHGKVCLDGTLINHYSVDSWRQSYALSWFSSLFQLSLQYLLRLECGPMHKPDGRPAEHRWRPLFNAPKFGWRPLLDAMQ